MENTTAADFDTNISDSDTDSDVSVDSATDTNTTEEVSTMSNSDSVDSTVSEVVSAAPATVDDPDTKLLEGIDFADREVMAKQAELALTRTRIESFQKALVTNQERVAELELETVEPSSDRRSEALAKVSVLRSIGMTNEAIRAALKQQYGMIKPNANRPLSPPNSAAVDQHVKVRKLSEAGQARILEIVRAAGVNGIGRADIKEKLEAEGVVVSDENDVSKVLKNAVLDGQLVASGLTKGMRYSYCA